MNWDQIKGQWRQVTGQVKSTWGMRYGLLKGNAKKQIDDWLAKIDWRGKQVSEERTGQNS